MTDSISSNSFVSRTLSHIRCIDLPVGSTWMDAMDGLERVVRCVAALDVRNSVVSDGTDCAEEHDFFEILRTAK